MRIPITAYPVTTVPIDATVRMPLSTEAPLIASKNNTLNERFIVTQGQERDIKGQKLDGTLSRHNEAKEELNVLQKLQGELLKIKQSTGPVYLQHISVDEPSFISGLPSIVSGHNLNQPSLFREIQLHKNSTLYQKCKAYYDGFKDNPPYDDKTFGYDIANRQAAGTTVSGEQVIHPDTIKEGKVPMWLVLTALDLFSTLHPSSASNTNVGMIDPGLLSTSMARNQSYTKAQVEALSTALESRISAAMTNAETLTQAVNEDKQKLSFVSEAQVAKNKADNELHKTAQNQQRNG